MVISKFTTLKPINKTPNLTCIVDFVDIKDYTILENGAVQQVVITYALCVNPNQWELFLEEQAILGNQKAVAEENEKLKDACETILTTDPFGAKYSGWKLIDIYKANFLWVDQALKEMRNKYIVERLKIIKEAVDNGKITI